MSSKKTSPRNSSSSSSIDNWGQLNNLTDVQKECLVKFKQSASPLDIELAKFSVESVDNASLRFLRARNFDVSKALILLGECCQRKKEANAMQYTSLAPDDCAKCNVTALKNYYPHNTLGYDKFNRPILFEHSGGINPAAIAQMTTKANLINYHWWTMEHTLNRMFEGAVERVGNDPSAVPISTCVVLDFTGLNLSHCSSKMMEHVKLLVQIDNCCYPELLGKMLVINAPWLAGKKFLKSVACLLLIFSLFVTFAVSILIDCNLIISELYSQHLGGCSSLVGPTHSSQGRNPRCGPRVNEETLGIRQP